MDDGGFSSDFPLVAIKLIFSKMNASEVAELFLSPYIDASLLNESTADEGPSMWIVNRSDVFDATLAAMALHPLPTIAARAREKLGLRKSQLIFLSPPDCPENLAETPDYIIEDLLGHPLVPLQIPLFFSHHLLEDFRSSAALSLTRRLLEHAPNWNYDLSLKYKMLENFFQLLLEDPSPLVRSYIARIPMFEESHISEAFRREKNDFVRARLLQNPASTLSLIEEFSATSAISTPEGLIFSRVVALDSRIPKPLRTKIAQEISKFTRDSLSAAIHNWYLKKIN